MTALRVEKIVLPAASLNGESSLPALSEMSNTQQLTRTDLDEDDELFIGYGFLRSIFPYRMQDLYGSELAATAIDAAILENEYLRATFLPGYGGRLYSLFDKAGKRELTFCNPAIRPRNLAVRNAWLSGGIEWNCGMVGHHPFTCAPLFTARLKMDDGTPVLRMYEFERIRRAVYQMDFFLPENSRLLFARMRIVNPNREVVPMYWWSNIAVPGINDGRVIMNADVTYNNRNGTVGKNQVPIDNGVDITYPVNNPTAIDFFWKIEPDQRKFVCQLDKEGYGLVETSTKRLKGRKLFVWGQGPGGDRWQEFLSAGGSNGRYAEIQAGLAHTQYECLPMPPKTAWEWLEAYGALQADGKIIHGEWSKAIVEVETQLTRLVSEDAMAGMLRDTHALAVRKADELVGRGSGWGALENLRRAKAGEELLGRHLDFGDTGTEQEPWLSLLHNGHFADEDKQAVPVSWMLQSEWVEMMKTASQKHDQNNWYAHMQLGAALFARGEFEKAKAALNRSVRLTRSCWALSILAAMAKMEGDNLKAANLAREAAERKPEDVSLAKEAVKRLADAGVHAEIPSFCATLPPHVAKNERIKMCLAFAHVRTGNVSAAEQILFENGALSVADVREGENSVTDLWFEIQEAKAKAAGKSFDRNTARPPKRLDFRMFVAVESV